MATQYQVLLVIESVELDDKGDNVPDTRDEEHHELVSIESSLESAQIIIDALLDAKDSIERISSWLNKNKNN